MCESESVGFIYIGSYEKKKRNKCGNLVKFFHEFQLVPIFYTLIKIYNNNFHTFNSTPQNTVKKNWKVIIICLNLFQKSQHDNK